MKQRGGSLEGKLTRILKFLGEVKNNTIPRGLLSYTTFYNIDVERVSEDEDAHYLSQLEEIVTLVDTKISENEGLSESNKNTLLTIKKHAINKINVIKGEGQNNEYFTRNFWEGMTKELQEDVKKSEQKSEQKGGAKKKEYVIYQSHRYLVRKEGNKKYIVSGTKIYLSSIRGLYKKL